MDRIRDSSAHERMFMRLTKMLQVTIEENNIRAFTLIELLVVIAITGIFTSAAPLTD